MRTQVRHSSQNVYRRRRHLVAALARELLGEEAPPSMISQALPFGIHSG